MQDSEIFNNFSPPEEICSTFNENAKTLLLANSKAVHKSAVLNQLKAENAPKVDLTFSLATLPLNQITELIDADNNNAPHQSVELNSALLHALNAQTDKKTTELAPSLATVQNMTINNSCNNLPFDIEVTCKLKNQEIGSHTRGMLPSQNSEDIGKSLCVLHAGSSVQNTQTVHTSSRGISNFETVCKYKDAMGFNPRDHATITKARTNKEVNYFSPLFKAEGGANSAVINGDCFMELAYRNGHRFEQPITARRIETICADTQKPTSKLEVEMAEHDWNLLMDAYDSAITHPLDQSVCNIDPQGEPTTLNFFMQPILNNQAVNWKQISDTFAKSEVMKGHQKAHATCNAVMEILPKTVH